MEFFWKLGGFYLAVSLGFWLGFLVARAFAVRSKRPMAGPVDRVEEWARHSGLTAPVVGGGYLQQPALSAGELDAIAAALDLFDVLGRVARDGTALRSIWNRYGWAVVMARGWVKGVRRGNVPAAG